RTLVVADHDALDDHHLTDARGDVAGSLDEPDRAHLGRLGAGADRRLGVAVVAALAVVGWRGGVAGLGETGREVGGVVVGVDAAATGAEHRVRVRRSGRRARALVAVGGRTEPDEVDDTGRAGAAERGRRVDQ